jgi:hypothetical protein
MELFLIIRKLAELGFHRSAKKCKEKFENVYKYHKRTKEGRTGKADGKTYRFFDQLEALESNPPIQSPTPPKPQPHQTAPVAVVASTTTVAMQPLANPPRQLPPQITVTSAAHTMNMSQGAIHVTPPINLTTIPSFPQANPTVLPPPPPFPNLSADLISNSTSSSTSSDEELDGVRRRRERKWKDFFERLMKEVVEKQEELQKRFLEAIEKRERERMVREEAWRVQEMARINREREILAQERSIAAAKDAAVMAFLQKISEQQNPGQVIQYSLPQPQAAKPAPPPPAAKPALPPQPAPVSTLAVTLPAQQVTGLEIQKLDNGENFTPTGSSRWPKVEVQALINLRTNLDAKYQDSGPKGPLWEEISAAMRKIGYSRSAKRCKEKWENINKYFKKVKESNKKRPEDSKTCPYFHQLDALYRERNKFENPSANQVKPDNSMVPLMVRPEQQWPPRQEEHPRDAAMEDAESEPRDQNQEEDDKDIGDDDEDEEEDEGGENYEIVASKPASMGAAE